MNMEVLDCCGPKVFFDSGMLSEVCYSFSMWLLQVLQKLDALQAERAKLEDQWNKKQNWLETIHLEQVFYRDVNSMDKTSSSQEVHYVFV